MKIIQLNQKSPVFNLPEIFIRFFRIGQIILLKEYSRCFTQLKFEAQSN